MSNDKTVVVDTEQTTKWAASIERYRVTVWAGNGYVREGYIDTLPEARHLAALYRLQTGLSAVVEEARACAGGWVYEVLR